MKESYGATPSGRNRNPTVLIYSKAYLENFNNARYTDPQQKGLFHSQILVTCYKVTSYSDL